MNRRPLTSALVLALVVATSFIPATRPARAAEKTPTPSLAAATPVPTADLWREVDVTAMRTRPEELIVTPRAYRVFQLDEVALAETLDRAPLEFTERARVAATQVVMTIPMPDGT